MTTTTRATTTAPTTPGGATHRPTPGRGPAVSRGPAPVVVGPRGRRRPGLVALGVVLTAVGALAATWLVASAGDRTPVLVLARDVPAGTVLTVADLASTDAALDPAVAVVPATDEATVLGLVAAVDLSAGSLLAPAQVAPAAPPAAGEVLVPLPVTPSQLPAAGVTAGDRLLVVDTPTDADPAIPPLTIPVTVVRLGPADVNGLAVLDVVTPAGNGPAVAVRAATGRFALVLLPAGEGEEW